MPNDEPRTWKSHRKALGATFAVLLVHAGILLTVAFTTCVTHDEYWHIPAGLWNATEGRFDYENLNPPLPRVLSAIPLILAGAETGDVKDGADKETRADTFVAANHDRYSTLVSCARLATILLSLITAWTLASWAMELFGPGAAVVSAALWCFSPNVLANACLVTSDAPAACAMLLVIRAAWKYADRPTWRRALWLGLWLGAAQLMKFTCLLALPMVIVIWWIRRLRHRDSQTLSLTIKQWTALLLLSLLTINAGYLFSGSGRPLNEYVFQSQSMISVQNLAPWKSMPVLLPADYVEGIDHQRTVMEQPHPVYLNGEWSFEGYRNYFLYTWWSQDTSCDADSVSVGPAVPALAVEKTATVACAILPAAASCLSYPRRQFVTHAARASVPVARVSVCLPVRSSGGIDREKEIWTSAAKRWRCRTGARHQPAMPSALPELLQRTVRRARRSQASSAGFKSGLGPGSVFASRIRGGA